MQRIAPILIGLATLAPACSFDGIAPGDSDPGGDAAVAQCVAPPAGIVGWWDGDVPGVDITGNASSTGDRGTPTTDTGLVGQATRFGENDLFEIDPAPTPASFTIEGWMNLDQGDAENWIGVFGRFGESSLCIYRNRLTYWEGSVGGGGANGNLALGSILQPGTWYHVALSWDGTTVTSYLDGARDSSEVVEDEVALPSEVAVGGLFNNQAELRDRFVGRLDELTLYSRALDATEISAIAAAGALGKCKP